MSAQFTVPHNVLIFWPKYLTDPVKHMPDTQESWLMKHVRRPDRCTTQNVYRPSISLPLPAGIVALRFFLLPGLNAVPGLTAAAPSATLRALRLAPTTAGAVCAAAALL